MKKASLSNVVDLLRKTSILLTPILEPICIASNAINDTAREPMDL